jgi:2-polyprenyl-3-methyl-5-hydroxy-6-metoxy-1,4-benzoquinol methylase
MIGASMPLGRGYVTVERCPVCGFDDLGDRASAPRVLKDIEINDDSSIAVVAVGYFQECNSCSTKFQNPRLNDRAIQDYYALGIYAENIKPQRTNAEYNAETLFTTSEFFVWLELTGIKPKTHLDVGGSTGAVGKKLSDLYETATFNLEMDRKRVEYSEKVNEVPCLSNFPPAGIEFELITAFEVVEHTPNPVGFIKELYDRVEDGGYLVISVPNLEEAPLVALGFNHIIAFTPESLKLAVKQVSNEEVVHISEAKTSINLWLRKWTND